MKLRLFFRQVELVDQEHWDLIKDEFSIEKKNPTLKQLKDCNNYRGSRTDHSLKSLNLGQLYVLDLIQKLLGKI